ncbi:unnamed protein product, partial [marine sediment metagenome]
IILDVPVGKTKIISSIGKILTHFFISTSELLRKYVLISLAICPFVFPDFEG